MKNDEKENKISPCVSVKNNMVRITLSPTLYSRTTVVRAAYRLLESYAVRVLGDGIKEIIVEIRPRDKHASIDENLIDVFFAELLQAEMEETNLKRFGDVRKVLLELAVRGLADLKKENEKGSIEDETERSV